MVGEWLRGEECPEGMGGRGREEASEQPAYAGKAIIWY
jgi:hypothetical protein